MIPLSLVQFHIWIDICKIEPASGCYGNHNFVIPVSVKCIILHFCMSYSSKELKKRWCCCAYLTLQSLLHIIDSVPDIPVFHPERLLKKVHVSYYHSYLVVFYIHWAHLCVPLTVQLVLQSHLAVVLACCFCAVVVESWLVLADATEL